MSKVNKVEYVDAPGDVAAAINAAKRIDDFLPAPAFFAEALAKEKISLNVDHQTVEQFRAYAKQHGIKYQALMNRVLGAYAETWLQANIK